jgi:hypothetical protein
MCVYVCVVLSPVRVCVCVWCFRSFVRVYFEVLCTCLFCVHRIGWLLEKTTLKYNSPVCHTGFTTGGGFSSKFDAPWYQTDFVDEYLNAAKLPPAKYFNSKGRGYNDVAALGSNILIVMGGGIGSTGGTSASGLYRECVYFLCGANQPTDHT